MTGVPDALRPGRWFGIIAVVLVATLAAAGWVQWRQDRLLGAAVRGSDYLQVTFNQLQIEYLRLRSAWLAAEQLGERNPLQLRYDIFVSRVDLLQTDAARALLLERPDFGETHRSLREFVARADQLLGPATSGPLDRAALVALQADLEALDAPLQSLSLVAAHRLAEQLSVRSAAIRQYNRVAIALTVLLSVTTVLFGLLAMAQLRRLDGRRREQEALAASLGEARRAAEVASEAKSTFLANMSHEIRTPFHGLLGMLSLLRETQIDGRQRDFLRTATESADHLLAILNDILDMSKLEAGSLGLAPAPMNVARLCDDVRALMQPAIAHRGLAFAVEVDAALPRSTLADVTRVKQVLFNLLSNAIKFCDAGKVSLVARRRGDLAEFVVADTGIGMDEATLARLFQRFTQGDASRSRRHGGTGLGLEISRNLARLMGGDITVTSRPGRGSEFVFSLPLAASLDAEPVPAPAALPSAVQRRLEVLAAEDHPVNRIYLTALLERMGHVGEMVENGAEAVDAFRHRAESGPAFDLILMDVHMPTLDGMAATERIRAMNDAGARVPIVALTADVFPETRERCTVAGMDEVLAKPVGLEQLSAAIARVMEARGAVPH